MRGQATNIIVHYKGNNEDYIVFAESAQAVQDWKADRSIPLAQVVNGFKIFKTHKHGTQGQYDGASNGELDAEFGTHKDDDVITQILEKGNVQSSDEQGRRGDTNDTMGGRVAH